MTDKDVLSELASEGNSNGLVFRFFGNSSAFLNVFFESSFVFHPYHSDSMYEYNFEGKLVKISNRKEWESQNQNVGWWKSNLPKTITKVAQTFHDCWSFEGHGIKTLKHPFKRTRKYTGFNNEKNFPALSKFNDIHYDNSEVEEWTCGLFVLTRFCKGKNVIFVISKNNEILSVMENGNYDFVDGDSGTQVYILNNKNILIYNDGDSPSVLLITNSSNTTLTPITENIVLCSQNVEEFWTKLRQGIINLLFSILDEKVYGIYNTSDANLFHIRKRNQKKLLLAVSIDSNNLLFTNCIDDSDFEFDMSYVNYESILELCDNILKITN